MDETQAVSDLVVWMTGGGGTVGGGLAGFLGARYMAQRGDSTVDIKLENAAERLLEKIDEIGTRMERQAEDILAAQNRTNEMLAGMSGELRGMRG